MSECNRLVGKTYSVKSGFAETSCVTEFHFNQAIFGARPNIFFQICCDSGYVLKAESCFVIQLLSGPSSHIVVVHICGYFRYFGGPMIWTMPIWIVFFWCSVWKVRMTIWELGGEGGRLLEMSRSWMTCFLAATFSVAFSHPTDITYCQ